MTRLSSFSASSSSLDILSCYLTELYLFLGFSSLSSVNTAVAALALAGGLNPTYVSLMTDVLSSNDFSVFASDWSLARAYFFLKAACRSTLGLLGEAGFRGAFLALLLL